MRKTLSAGVVIGAVAAFAAFAPAHAISDSSADLSVLHGIPDTPVDVYVNGDLTLDDFQPGSLAGPLDLPAGDYEVALTATDAADASAPVLGPITLTLEAGKSYTAVANLDADGEPTANLFTNDISPTAPGDGRLTVRHVAAAPAVDVLANGAAVVTGLVNPEEATLNLPAGVVSAAVALEGTTDPVIGPADVDVQEGVLTIAYAWGSAEDGNLALAVQTVTGLHSNPGGVNTGSAGLVAESQPLIWTVALGGGLLLVLAAGSVVAVRRSTAQRR
ncbi:MULTISPECIES: DUF4397 domain-containing protein [unclassified Microbacterium]|uniref:DUF4397 domain-containing protein n=1 Tax=unclassified Microbacterium TaxID=2609290 RepID=UPI00214BE60E|nr:MULTISPECIES: DUF4397 domain-containing protein [unclassified Microbacterium]MCR2784545.1 DUF4397 domain-containing protein [Microbacterium sp. zg.B96]WIM14645.1 DUF4397 domain-containing protein [Microbacterium sp. zg-B96]